MVILHELSNLKFLTKHNQYFLNHDLSVIPDELRWLNALSKCEVVKGTLEIMSMVEDLTKNAKKHVRFMASQPMRAMVDINHQRAKKGVDFRIIYPSGVEVPKVYRPKKGLSLEVRLLEKVNFSMKLNEDIAGLVLPDLDGKIDYEFGLMGEEPKFRRWSELLFDYFWEQAESAF
jgi:predicted transcriptional regulator